MASALVKKKKEKKKSSIGMVTCFSAPRCLSTSLMYSFNSRPETRVVDEPTYAHYVSTTGVCRPYEKELFATQNRDGYAVLSALREDAGRACASGEMVYVKHIAKLCTAPTGFIEEACKTALLEGNGRAFILVRDPRRVLRSWSKVLPASLEESGFPGVEAAFDTLMRMTAGKGVVVVDAQAIAEKPTESLQRLCAALEIPWDERMLEWKRGGIPEDGCWKDYWYKRVHESTCFQSAPKEESATTSELPGDAHTNTGGGARETKTDCTTDENDEDNTTPERDAMMRECIRIYDKLRWSPLAILP